MSQFLKGMLVGLSITAVIATYSYAIPNQPSEEVTGETVVSKFAIEPGVSNCELIVGYGRIEYGDRCWNGDVVTGFLNGNIRCSTLQLRCR